MRVLIGGFLTLFGLIFFAIGGIPLIIDLASGHQVGFGQNMVNLPFAIIGGIILVVGLTMLLTGLSRAKKLKAQALLIYERGVEAEGTITFVDKNYSLLVNNKPIYSIVEFKFRDRGGQEHISRKNNVESDLVIRLKLEVGSKVKIKYLNEDPQQNILLLVDPLAAA